MKKVIEIIPSILGANFVNLEAELEKCNKSDIEWIHYDVMDFDFVPNLTFGSKILNDIVEKFNFKIDIHFMVKIKTKTLAIFLKDFLLAKPKMMTMHAEALKKKQLHEFFKICNENNVIPSIALNPNTKIAKILPYISQVGNVLVMSVNPGFGGQVFNVVAIDKIKELNRIKQVKNLDFSIEIDGGINDKTFKLINKIGVEKVVAGSYLFSGDFSKNKEKLK